MTVQLKGYKTLAKKNCWEFSKCGREPGGQHVDDLGECAAALKKCVNGIHDGKNGGRCCWLVAGTLCEAKASGSFAQKIVSCLGCNFYVTVAKEQGEDIVPDSVVLKKLEEA